MTRENGARDNPWAAWDDLACPACGNKATVFAANGGYLTCSWIDCPEPGAPHDFVERVWNEAVERVRSAESEVAE